MIHCREVAMDHEYHRGYCQAFAQLLSLNKQKVLTPESIEEKKNGQ